ncbi:MAG: prenyltransferase [Leptospirales bacterium]|nr:prenyltransferase [Leptospirales bacterium]
MSYEPLTFKAIKELVSPHTLSASILPVLLAGALSYTLYNSFSLIYFLLLMAISILMQFAVNTFNDYFDYIKGTDREDNFFDKSDASIVYNNINPKAALMLGIFFLSLALLGGLYLVWQFGLPLLVIGFLGAFTVYFYSGGPYPISYLPIGEFISGFMMGGLLPMAAIYVLTETGHALSLQTLYYCAPLIIGIGLILLTNNTCDVERDTIAGRHTLPILLGKKLSGRLLFFCFLFLIAVIAHLSFYHFRYGIWLILLLVAHSALYLKRIWQMEFTAVNRSNAMKTTLVLTTITNCYYILIVFLGKMLS